MQPQHDLHRLPHFPRKHYVQRRLKRMLNHALIPITVVGILTFIMSMYLLSPFWAVRHLRAALQLQDTAQLRARIPKPLLDNLIPDTHPDHHWRGAGQVYLRHVWPRMYNQIDRYAWLSLQAQETQERNDRRYYVHHFYTYAYEIGKGSETLRFELKRVGFVRWKIERVCYPSPQPDLVVNRCPSSKR